MSPLVAYSSSSDFHCALVLWTRIFGFGVDWVVKLMGVAEVVMVVSPVVSKKKCTEALVEGE